VSYIDALVTAGFTTMLGFIAFVVGQFALKLVVEPIQEQRRLVGEVAYAEILTNTVSKEPHADDVRRARHELRVSLGVDP